jgi:hypothetical protein
VVVPDVVVEGEVVVVVVGDEVVEVLPSVYTR